MKERKERSYIYIISHLSKIVKFYDEVTVFLQFFTAPKCYHIVNKGGDDVGFKKINPNPYGNRVGDCVVRGIAILTGCSWERAYLDIAVQGFIMGDMPSANAVWGAFLKRKGYKQYLISDDITVADFARQHSRGAYLLGSGTHVVTVVNGDYCDTWDSGDEMPIYYFYKERDR